jgi:hypothetical protein
LADEIINRNKDISETVPTLIENAIKTFKEEELENLVLSIIEANKK